LSTEKNYLIFGAGGSIGSEVAQRLARDENCVIASIRYRNARSAAVIEKLQAAGAITDVLGDVSDRSAVQKCFERNCMGMFDGVIYAVGHCPPGGFPDAIKYPLSQLPVGLFMNEIAMYQIGVLNVFQIMLPLVKDGGCFTFISSAITRLTDEEWPSFLQAHYHAAMISAEDWLIRGMRMDPAVKRRGIKIHRLAPKAVDTPFHQHEHGPKPPQLLSVETVVEKIVSSLTSEKTVDEQF